MGSLQVFIELPPSIDPAPPSTEVRENSISGGRDSFRFMLLKHTKISGAETPNSAKSTSKELTAGDLTVVDTGGSVRTQPTTVDGPIDPGNKQKKGGETLRERFLGKTKLDYYLKAEAAEPTGKVTLEDLIAGIRSDEFAEPVGQIRGLLVVGDKKAADAHKKNLPAISVSGTVTTGGRGKAVAEGRFAHSGLLQIDLDGKDNPDWTVAEMVAALKADPYIQAGFITPSGAGVKGLARIPADAANHKAAFLVAEAHFATSGLVIDPSCKDAVRLCFVSHDPDAWLRKEAARVFEVKPAAVAFVDRPEIDPADTAAAEPLVLAKPAASGGIIIRQTHNELTATGVREMLAVIPTRPVYDQWLRIASAVWDAIGEEAGTAALNEWSPEESPGEYVAKYPQRLTAVKAGTLVHMARERGWESSPSAVPTEVVAEYAPAPALPKPDGMAAILAERVFNFDLQPEQPIALFELCGRTLCTAGNIMNIQALPKVGKSAVIQSLIAATLVAWRRDRDTLGFTADNVEEHALIHFDTEQSRYDHDSLVRNAVRRAGSERTADGFFSYSVADLDIKDRRKALRHVMQEAYAAHGGIFAVMIDGIGDLCADPNDSAEAFGLVQELHAMAITYHCAIITVLHENPGSESGKTRGHLGSQLERKAECNLRLAKDKNGITTIWAERARHCYLPKSQGQCFAWNDSVKMHMSCGTAGEIRSATLRDTMQSEAERAFSDQDEYRHTDLIAAIGQALDFKEGASKNRVKKWAAEGIIRKNHNGNYTLTHP
jgi:hypothetical protein